MEKMEQYERVFSRFDSNGDGKICAEELKRCLESIDGRGSNNITTTITLEEAERAVTMMDTDGDGLLCFEDFVRLVEGAGEEERAGDLMEAFRMYEMEGSGRITPKSLRRMLSRLGERASVAQCRNMIARFDINGDGVLDFDEFKIMMSC